MPEARIVGFFNFNDAIFVSRLISLTPQPLGKNYYSTKNFSLNLGFLTSNLEIIIFFKLFCFYS